MALFGRKKKTSTESEKSDSKENKETKHSSKKTGKKKKKERVGSRWAALVLLLVTVIVGLVVWMSGSEQVETNPNKEQVDVDVALPGWGESNFQLE